VEAVGRRGGRFEPPVARRATVVRRRLLDRLQGRFRVPVSVVIAPAGLGKTTLLAQAVAENRLSAGGVDRWLTCTAADAATSSLVEGLCRALGTPPPASLDEAAVRVADAMWHRSPEEVALVVDDVHEVPAGSGGGEVLNALVAALPRNGHLVLSGRPPLPVRLARLDVSGEVLHVTERDLLCTDDELAELAALRNVDVERLRSCGGWAALAELAASAVPGVEAAYLWEEVLARVEPERRRDIALLAQVGPFDDDLATAVLGREVDVAALTADIPLVTTTSHGVRRIHDLWRPHLGRELSATETTEARRRGGLRLVESGDVAAGVGLLADTDAWDDVSRIVAGLLAAPDPPIPGDVVAGWLGRLPDEMVGGSLARLLRAVVAVQTDPVAATRDLHDAAEAFRQEGDTTGELACMAQLAQLAWWSEQPQRLAALAARLFEMEALGQETAVPLACLARALIANVMADATGVLAELDRIPPGALGSTSQSLVDWLRSTSWSHLGHQAEALETATRACAQASPLYAPVVEHARMEALWLLGGIDEVVDALPALVERTAATGLRDFTAFMAAMASLAFAGAGRTAEAARYLERARRSAANRDAPLLDVDLVIADATLAVASGDEPRATRQLDDYLQRSPPLGTGLAAYPQRHTLPLWYVLVPESRSMWDSTPLGPSHTTARDLARALVAVRATGRLPASSPPLPAPELVRSMMPLPWATELTLAHVAAGRRTSWSSLEALWPQAQLDVRRHADDSTAPLRRAARTALARLPVPPSGHLELALLGPVELRRDGHLIDTPEWRRERVRSLLAHLTLHRHVNRERLAADLWPTLDMEAQSRNLRVNLTHLLRVLEPERRKRDASFLIRTHGDGLSLHQGDWFHADIWRFDEFWQHATDADRQRQPAAALDALQQAVALWRDEPSDLARDDWALPLVEERRLQLVTMATRSGELLLARGEPAAARQMAETAIAADPWSERAHHTLVAAHTTTGDDTAASREIDRYHRALNELSSSSPT
jgi:DNA-binding SARP family transcriptional activator